nr:phospholipid carrier-dependent glycosyltransferase [Simiduia aestuariiviva]
MHNANTVRYDAWLARYFYWLLVGVLLLAATLRFWQLDAVATAYFDEINVPQFGYALLNDLPQTPFMTAHPPLPHYLFAGAMALYYQLPWVAGAVTDPWAAIDPLSYRWLTAAAGTLCCLLLAMCVRRLGGSPGWALLAAGCVAIDGALIVDSRTGLNNMLMLTLGLAALWAFAVALQQRWRWLPLLVCGVLLGATVATKWNGLGFWLVPAALMVGALCYQFGAGRALSPSLPWVTHAQWLRLVVCLWLVPAVTYWLLWQPYLAHEAQWGFIEIHQRMQAFHTQEVGAAGHPYCSAWYQWPYQGRPMSYFFQPESLAAGEGYLAIHLLGNPFLYPLSWLAVLALTLRGGRQLWCCARQSGEAQVELLALVIPLAFWANWLPWSLVDRCLFSYHYEPASVFAFAALAGVMLHRDGRPMSQAAWLSAGLCLLAIVWAAVYFLPLALGLPLSHEAFYDRMWLRAWI